MIEIKGKCILLGDTHFGHKTSEIDRKKDYDNKKVFFVKQLIPYMKEHNINNIIQLGDFFDNRLNLSVYVVNKIKEDIFDLLESENINLITLIGNHDMNKSNTRDINSWKMFDKAYSNIHVVETKSELVRFNNKNLLLVPWMLNEDEANVSKAINDTNPDLILGHFEIRNFSVSKTTKAEHGLKENFFLKIPVISGHFHIPQKRKNIEYIGTPYQTSWSDYNIESGFYVLNETLEKEFIKNNCSHKHLKVVIHSESKKLEVLGYGYEYIKDINSKTDYSIFNNNRLKIFIDVDNAWNKKIIEKIKEYSYSYVIDIKPKEETQEELQTNIDDDFNIDKSIYERLSTNYQKEVFNKIAELANLEEE